MELNGFINKGTDDLIVKSLDKTKLVQKEITVQTKRGTHTRKQWVRASEEPKSSTSPRTPVMSDEEFKKSRPNLNWPERINATTDEWDFADNAVEEYRKSQKFSIPTEYVQKYKGVTPETYCQLKMESLPEGTDDGLREEYLKAIAAEPEITKVVQSVIAETGGQLFGTDFRIKEGDSFVRKMQKTAKQTGKTPQECAQANTDTVRYTNLSDADNLVADYHKMTKALIDAGNKPVIVHNLWQEPHLGMNCIECVFEHPSGQKFEIWFHTPETKHVQDHGGHRYYEAFRVMDDKEQAAKIEQVCYQMYYSCPIPKGIEDIKDFRR